MNELNKIIIVENEYLKNNLSREMLLSSIRSINLEFQENVEKLDDKEEVKYCKMAMLYIIERIKQTVLIEDKLIEIVNSETAFVSDHMRRLLFDILRMTMVQNDRKQAFEYDQMAHNETYRIERPKRRANFSVDVCKILKSWLQENLDNPYPSDTEKVYLCQQTGLDPGQINNWFINARRRILPFMKEKYDDV